MVATQLRFGRYLTERFMPMRRQRLQSTTAYRYEWMIEHYINPVLGSMPCGRSDQSTSAVSTTTCSPPAA